MDSNSKRQQVERYLKGAKRLRSRDELKLIAENAKQRKGRRQRRPPRRKGWIDEDSDAAGEFLEKMGGGPRTDLSQAPRKEPPEVSAGPRGPLAEGLVLAPFGRRARVLVQGREALAEVDGPLARGALVVGDEVAVETLAPGRLRVVARGPRRSALTRQDPSNPRRERTLAANVDLGVVVIAAGAPRLRSGIIDRIWIALSRAGVRTVLAVNKIDRVLDRGARAAVEELYATYRGVDLPIHRVSALDGHGLRELAAAIHGCTVVFLGQSGVGKSSLLNGLDPAGARAVKAVRGGDDRGRHTTSASHMRILADGSRLVDTPGVRAFGLARLEPAEVLQAFGDLAALAGGCRFSDCRHDGGGGAGCALEAAAQQDGHLARRLATYRRILASLDEAGGR